MHWGNAMQAIQSTVKFTRILNYNRMESKLDSRASLKGKTLLRVRGWALLWA
jgi:hypothetical protein